ncbi:unnamed protein product [Toxocara canis]|uniref:Non-specific serine/threonine protein kinase n=1 Tax=Toxocara canis TaxID=6265 RepID=A0A183V7L6_TOXCA|nr:unnamed protein product [Toxocara canis]
MYACRQIFDTVARIQYAPLRLCTSLNFMRLFVSLTCWSDSAIWAFAPLLNGIPSRAFNAVVKRALVEMYADRSQTMMSDYSANTLFDAYLLHCYDDFKNARAYAAITWVLAEVKGVSHMLFNSVCDYIVRDSEISLSFMYLDILLYLWIEGDHKRSNKFICVAQLFIRVHYLGTLTLVHLAKFRLTISRLLIRFIDDSLQFASEKRAHGHRAPYQSLNRGVKAHEPHERFVSEALMVNRLQLLLRFPWSVDLPAEEILRACVDELHGSFSWEHRCALLNVINTFLPQVQTSEKGIEVIEALVVVAEEERNSHNHLPAVNALLKACLHERMLAMDAIAKKSLDVEVTNPLGKNTSEILLLQSVVNKLMEQAAQNVELAFAICEALERTVEQLDAEWIPVLVDLCSYGPVPKKDTRVLHYAYEMAYSSKISPLLSDSPADQLHYIVQRIRIRALLLTRRVCARSGVLAAAIMKRLIDVSTLLDKAHSKSFGLSLSHRRKTRLMQLALLILDTVDEASLCELVEHCKQCVVNTAQQFSIKLFVEYILVRIYFRHQNLFNRFIDSQKEELIERCLILFLPWCTAQNFSVRCTAIAAIKCLWPIADEKMHQKLEYLRAIIDFDMEASGNSKRIIDNLCNDFYFAHFHAEDHFSLQTILKTFPEKTGLPSEEVIPIHIFAECSNDCPIKQRCNDEKFNEAPSLVYSGESLWLLRMHLNSLPDK